MTTSISPPRTTAVAHRSLHRQAVSRPGQPRSSAPSCPLQARPQPHPQPAPTWEELLGQR